MKRDPFKRPGWSRWAALWAEILCNVFGCDWDPTPYSRVWMSGGIAVHYPTKCCKRCRRSVDAK